MAKIAKKTKRYPSDLTDEEWAPSRRKLGCDSFHVTVEAVVNNRPGARAREAAKARTCSR
jgi:hypothetical protein